MTSWHPATKALVGVAIIALPYLAWTSLGEAPAAVAVVRQPVAAQPAAAVVPAAAESIEPIEAPTLRQLPAVERFSEMLERPLFSPTRRPVLALAEPEAGPEEPEVEDEAVEAPAGAPAVRFVGTIGQSGGMTALVLRDEATAVEKLVVGDEVDGWRVTSVTAAELVMEHEAERLVLTILQ